MSVIVILNMYIMVSPVRFWPSMAYSVQISLPKYFISFDVYGSKSEHERTDPMGKKYFVEWKNER